MAASVAACRCLNVRLAPQPSPTPQPDFLVPGPDYDLVYVGSEGITITHPQLTMRTRKIIAHPTRSIRFTTLTCLLCQTPVYRVQQPVAPDMDTQEGPLLPSSDWVEHETLLSSCGWIELHRDSLLAEQVTRLSASSTYSSTFGIALPHTAVLAPPPSPANQSPQTSPVLKDTAAGPFLYDLKPLFPPAPFVPSHPVFAHLSSIAVKASGYRRSLAEEQIAAIVRDRCAQLEQADDQLRQDVQALWRTFVENITEVEKQIRPRVKEPRKRDTSRGVGLSASGVSGVPLVSVRNFVPTPSAAPRTLSPPSPQRVSSLSVSLATSAFRHVRVDQESLPVDSRERPSSDSPRSPPPYSSHPSSLGSAEGSSLGSSPQLSPRVNGDSIMQPFKRSMDETRDTAVSFRYFTILEADVARARQQVSQPDLGSDGPPKSAKEKDNANVTKITTSAKEAEETLAHRPENSDRDMVSPTDGSPRKRKVKFDVKAEAIGDEEINRDARGNEELIFDLEDGSSDPESSDAVPTLPFIENAQIRRRGRHRVANLGTLPAPLSSLRPTSLPAYSDVQPKGVEAMINMPNNTSRKASPALLSQETPAEVDPQEEEILKLVAASVPSHRSAWKRNSKAWQLFVSRRRNGVPGALIPEESEDGSGRLVVDTDDSGWNSSRGFAGFATSLPIDISPLSRRREPLSLASYQPKTSLSDRAGMIVPALPDGRPHLTSATLRKASYAERDRLRAMDPGALDFLAGVGEDAEGEESDEESSRATGADEGRGRQRAFKILQARSKVPEAGMWMSLA